MKKHAFLLMIHEQNSQLNSLLKQLDYYRYDIYVHVDKKCANFNQSKIKSTLHHANIYFISRHKLYWGSYKIVEAEIALLRASLKNGEYSYYHLISGSDLLLVSNDHFIDFFDRNAGKEFIHFGNTQYQHDILSRYSQYHFFQKHFKSMDTPLWNKLETYSLAAQRRLKIIRNPNINFYGGSQWFSMTDSFARYIVHKSRGIKKIYKYSQIPDESFIQTLFMSSPYINNLYISGTNDDMKQNLRSINWKSISNGSPGIYKLDDYESLMNSECIFARKFDFTIDSNIVNRILSKTIEEHY